MSRPHADESVFRAIADPTRRRILDILRQREMTPAELIEKLPAKFANLTFHLRVLRSAKLVTHRRAGRERLYQIDPSPLTTAVAWLRVHQIGPAAAKSSRADSSS